MVGRSYSALYSCSIIKISRYFINGFYVSKDNVYDVYCRKETCSYDFKKINEKIKLLDYFFSLQINILIKAIQFQYQIFKFVFSLFHSIF